jgi:K+ transporter
MLDATFVVSNAHKIPQGGWFPLLVGSVALMLMLSWRRGREVALARREADAISLQTFIDEIIRPAPAIARSGHSDLFHHATGCCSCRTLAKSETQRRSASLHALLESG